ncbi:MAG: peptidylprolyl isomerase [Desulfobacterales bacterium]|nr:peptidylprolyl isomerase [Desulfobacterales bacterium]
MLSNLYRWTGVFLMFLVATGIATAQDQAPDSPSVATVNGVPISQEDFDFEFQQTIGQMAQQGQMVGEESMPMVRESVIGRMIEEELLYQDTQARGIEVVEQRVSQEMARVKARFGSEEEFQKTLSTLKISEDDLKRKIRRGLAIQQLIGQLVADVQVSDDEMKAFYEENTNLFQTPEQIQASHILIKVAPEADDDQKKAAQKKIRDLQKKVRAGEDFAELAKSHSEGPSSARGGDLGYFGRGQMVKPFEDAAFALEKDEVSEVVETRFGYHLIKLTDRRPAGTIEYEEAKERIAQNIKKEKDGQVVRQHLEMLRAKAEIETRTGAMPPTAAPATGG